MKRPLVSKNDYNSSNNSLALLVATYANHIVYCSVYLSVCCYCWNAAHEKFSQLLLGDVSQVSTQSAWIIAVYYLVVGLSAWALKAELTYIWMRWKLPPGDSSFPMLGCMPFMAHNNETLFCNYMKRYGPLYTCNVLMHPCVVVSEDQDLQWAMTMERQGKTTAEKLPFIIKLLGEEAIFVKSGDDHKKLRKIFEPAFTPLAIRDYASAIDTMAQEQLEKWCQSGEFQEPREWALLAMRIFFVCAFGEANEERMAKLAYLFENWILGFAAVVPLANVPGTSLYKAHQFKEALGQELRAMIDEFKSQNPPESATYQKSVMGRLCYAVDEDGNLPTEQQLIDNLRFFLFAGFDTTKASFSGITHFLKHNPKVEALLVEEVKKFPVDQPLDIDQLKSEAPILNAVLAESWRLRAPLANHTMAAGEDLYYKGYVIPKGTFICADIIAHNAMNERYPNGTQYSFERWLPKDHPLYDPQLANKEDIDYNVMNYKFRSFGIGPHMCLGGHFAKLEVRIVMTRLLQKYNIDIRNDKLITFPLRQQSNEFKVTKRGEE